MRRHRVFDNRQIHEHRGTTCSVLAARPYNSAYEWDFNARRSRICYMSSPETGGHHRTHRDPFCVALAQIEPKLGDLAFNAKLHLEQIETAQKQGADLVVFPELSLTGYYLRDDVVDVAQAHESTLLRELSFASATTAVVFGFVEESREHRFYNSCAYADGGAILAKHRKVYLPTYGMFDEQRYFAAGDRVRGFDTRFGRVGMLICEDAWHLSCGAMLLADAVDLVIIVANSPSRGVSSKDLGSQSSWDLLTRTYAQFVGAPVVFVNRAGYEDGVSFWGGSRVVSPFGEVLAEARELESGLVTATIDPRETRIQRIQAPLGRDERIELTIRELERIRDERYKHSDLP